MKHLPIPCSSQAWETHSTVTQSGENKFGVGSHTRADSQFKYFLRDSQCLIRNKNTEELRFPKFQPNRTALMFQPLFPCMDFFLGIFIIFGIRSIHRMSNYFDSQVSTIFGLNIKIAATSVALSAAQFVFDRSQIKFSSILPLKGAISRNNTFKNIIFKDPHRDEDTSTTYIHTTYSQIPWVHHLRHANAKPKFPSEFLFWDVFYFAVGGPNLFIISDEKHKSAVRIVSRIRNTETHCKHTHTHRAQDTFTFSIDCVAVIVDAAAPRTIRVHHFSFYLCWRSCFFPMISISKAHLNYVPTNK